MKILIVRGRGIDPAVNKMARCLSQEGYDVRLLVWDRQSTVRIDPSSGYSVHRCTIKAPYDNPMVLLYLPLWWIYELYYLLKSDCDVIHACDIDTIIPAVLAKFVRKTWLCYTIYDFYADCLSDRTPHIVRSFVAVLEKYLIRFTDALFLVDESRYTQIEGTKFKKIAYIYNTPPDCNPIQQKCDAHDPSTFVLFYAGSLHPDRGLIYVIEALQDLEGIKLVVAGTGPEKEHLSKFWKGSNRKIQYLGLLPYEVVINDSLIADMLFAFYDPTTPNNRYASPNKLFEAMMREKPILTNVVLYGDVNAIKRAILILKNNPALCKRLGENGRNAYESKYSWEIMEKRLLSMYRNIQSDELAIQKDPAGCLAISDFRKVIL